MIATKSSPTSPPNTTYEYGTILNPTQVANTVYDAIKECACTLRKDVRTAIEAASSATAEQNTYSRERQVLASLAQNCTIAQQEALPLCQDTGTVWVCLEVGTELMIPGTILSEVDDAVARAYKDANLRMSVVKDAAFDRTNTNTNTPAFTELKLIPGKSCRVHVMLKGGGSDNASRIVMLPPSAGCAGIIEEVLTCVREKAANACPPLIIGIGIGATFDKVAGLSKHALLREVGSPAPTKNAAALEQEILEAVNATEIGPGALGGTPTALAVHIESAPCHIAALPLAINLGCCAMRSTTRILINEQGVPIADAITPNTKREQL